METGATAALKWVLAEPAQSCQLVCAKKSLDPVFTQGLSVDNTAVFVCAAKKGNGYVPGANWGYSTKAAGLCHIQAAGTGTGEAEYSCLCASKTIQQGSD